MTDADLGPLPVSLAATQPRNSPQRVLFASLIGTTIEFFDFYIYATAAVLVFPKLFFPKGDPATAMLQSLATFALAFFARPVGSALFGHFGDRIGRKATLVTALLTMGISTVCIGLLCSTGVFLLMSNIMTEGQLFSWGWRLPFLSSAALVLVGLYVRLQLVE